MKNFLEKHVKQYDIGIAVVMLLTFLCCMFQPMYAADRALTDQMWQQPEGTNAKIKIIKIDEKTLSELGQYNTWTREIPAQLVEILSQDPENAPAVISFDILYINEMDKEGDERFAEACQEGREMSLPPRTWSTRQPRSRMQMGITMWIPFILP